MTSLSDNLEQDLKNKLVRYCVYQERCHLEVVQKCFELGISSSQKDIFLVYLIDNNYLNEERFALSFATGKFHQKKWGKTRIINELKQRHISDYLIKKAIKELDCDEYENTFQVLCEKIWNSITDKNLLKKRKKFCDTLLRKGWESDLIYEKAKEFENLG